MFVLGPTVWMKNKGFFQNVSVQGLIVLLGWMCINQSCSCVRLQQLHAIIAASVSIKSSQKLKKILEVGLGVDTFSSSLTHPCTYQNPAWVLTHQRSFQRFLKRRAFVLRAHAPLCSVLADNPGAGKLHEQQ